MNRKSTIVNEDLNNETFKMIREVCGKHLGLEKLSLFIKQSGLPDEWILRTALALNYTDIRRKNNWLSFRERFFALYADDLCRIIGVERAHFLPDPIGIRDQELLAHLMARVWKETVNEDYAWDHFIKNVIFCFDCSCVHKTLSLKIKGYL